MIRTRRIERTQTLHGGAKPLPYTYIEPESNSDLTMGFGYYRVDVGDACKLHRHERKGETWFVISGIGELRLGSDLVTVGPGTAIFTPPGVPHALRNIGSEPLVFVDVTSPRIGRDPRTGLPLDSIDME